MLRRAGDDGGLTWGVDLLGMEPTCYIELGGIPSNWTDEDRVFWSPQIIGDGDAIHDPNLSSSENREIRNALVKTMMPPIEIYNETDVVLFGTGWRDGSGEASGNWSNSAPARYVIFVTPRFQDEEFFVELPLDIWRNGAESPWSHIDISVTNSSNDGHRAKVRFIFLSGTYAGTRVPPGEWYDKPGAASDGDYRTLTLEEDEGISWRIDNIGGEWPAGSRITPTMNHADRDGRVVWSGDKFWEVNVKGRENCFPFSASGDLAPATGAHSFYNDRLENLGISLVRASVGSAPTGADIQIDVKVAGASILTAPLTIPAGQTTGTATPANSLFPFGETVPPSSPTAADYIALGLWQPGEALTVDILSVGSVDPGANLTVQVWAG